MLSYAILHGFYVRKEFQDGQMMIRVGHHLLNLDSDRDSIQYMAAPKRAIGLRQLIPYQNRGLITFQPEFYVYAMCSPLESEILHFNEEVMAIIGAMFNLFFQDRLAFRHKMARHYTPQPTLSLREIMIAHILQAAFPKSKTVYYPCCIIAQAMAGDQVIHTGAYWGMPVKQQNLEFQQMQVAPSVNRLVEHWLATKFEPPADSNE